MTNRACIVCRSSDLIKLPYFYVHEGSTYNIIRCRRCGQGVLDPMPVESVVRGLYSYDYFEKDYRCGSSDASYQSQVGSLQREFAPYLRMIKRRAPGGKFLEIGCAGGAVLDLARSGGFDVAGVEISEDIAAWGQSHFNIPIAVGTLEEQQFDANSFDAVYMGDVIEHLPDPEESLREIRRILRPGGVVALAFPMELNNIGAQLRIARGRPRKSPNKPYHLHYFNLKSMAQLLSHCGFSVQDAKSTKIIRKHPPASRFLDIANSLITAVTGLWADRGFVISVCKDETERQ